MAIIDMEKCPVKGGADNCHGDCGMNPVIREIKGNIIHQSINPQAFDAGCPLAVRHHESQMGLSQTSRGVSFRLVELVFSIIAPALARR